MARVPAAREAAELAPAPSRLERDGALQAGSARFADGGCCGGGGSSGADGGGGGHRVTAAAAAAAATRKRRRGFPQPAEIRWSDSENRVVAPERGDRDSRCQWVQAGHGCAHAV
jgi:hypothetical protein